MARAKKKAKGEIPSLSPEISVDINNPKDMEFLRNTKNTQPINFKLDGEMATGFVLPSNHPTDAKFLRELRDYNDPDMNVYRQMEISKKLYEHEGLVASAMNLLMELAVTKVVIENI